MLLKKINLNESNHEDTLQNDHKPPDRRKNNWCRYCRRAGHTKSTCWELQNLICKKCGLKGHTRKYCTSQESVDKLDSNSRDINNSAQPLTADHETQRNSVKDAKSPQAEKLAKPGSQMIQYSDITDWADETDWLDSAIAIQSQVTSPSLPEIENSLNYFQRADFSLSWEQLVQIKMKLDEEVKSNDVDISINWKPKEMWNISIEASPQKVDQFLSFLRENVKSETPVTTIDNNDEDDEVESLDGGDWGQPWDLKSNEPVVRENRNRKYHPSEALLDHRNICASWNKGARCYRNPCKFRHLCLVCQGRHKAQYCPSKSKLRTKKAIGYCKKFNIATCTGNCSYLHLCHRCKGQHSSRECEIADGDVQTCYEFNESFIKPGIDLTGKCPNTPTECEKMHICANCLEPGHTISMCKSLNIPIEKALEFLQKNGSNCKMLSKIDDNRVEPTTTLLKKSEKYTSGDECSDSAKSVTEPHEQDESIS